MAIYYKGYLNRLDYENGIIKYESSLLKSINNNTSKFEKEDIYYYFNNIHDRKNHDFPIKVSNETLIKKFNKLKFCYKANECKIELIFEKIRDENGIEYAREIYTKSIFPLIKENDISREYSILDLRKIYCSSDKDIDDFNVTFKPLFNCNISNILKLNNFFYLPRCEIADQNMIENYMLSTFKTKSFFKKEIENKKLIDNVCELSKKNVFKNEIIEKKEEKVIREKQNPITYTMERIEFLLLKLDKINHESKIEKQKKYEEMLNCKNNILTTSPLNNETLKMFEAELEFAIKFNQKKEDDILNTLDNIINEYNLNNKTDKTIKDIDELVRLFLQMKSNYSIITQRDVINKFALIYIYEIYENKDDIQIDELNNSYINDMLKSIMICLNNMVESNEIENNIIINLEENISLNYIINCIKNIKFTKQKVLTLS